MVEILLRCYGTWECVNRLSKIASVGVLFSMLLLINPLNSSYAEESQTTVVPLDDEMMLEQTVMSMNIPKDSKLPWAFVEGKINNPAPDYPVIIQFFNEQSGDKPMHVAQTEVNKDNDTYEYKLRVTDVDPVTGEILHIFEGNYTVKIFKVVISPDDLDSA